MELHGDRTEASAPARCRAPARRGARLAWCAAALLGLRVAAAAADSGLADLSLEQLSRVEVTSVSKSAEPWRDAPAAIYVITHDDILRAGVTTIADALRLAPNLRITQRGATDYVASARGFGGAQAAQNFSNKLLVLIDGRSVYSPLYSGVYLEVQDLVMDDIDRIEVISGPGATLWGANAVNGVINIITRPAYLTDGALVSVAGGNLERSASARYGARLDDQLALRAYAKVFRRDSMELADGASAEDGWNKAQGGFRADWSGLADSVAAQGDAYGGDQNQAGLGEQKVAGENLLARWQHRTDGGQWQLQGYFDQTAREQAPGGAGFVLRTYDLEAQDSLRLGSNRIVWGAGGRIHRYHISSSASLQFQPPERTLVLGDVFAQDTLALSARLDLTLGIKFERDPFSDWAPLPELRLAWRPSDQTMLWASAARAIRAPTPFDTDVVEKVGGSTFLQGNRGFEPEGVNAFELGYRGQPLETVSLSASLFYDVYGDLRTVEPHSRTQFVPLTWRNEMGGNTYGLEAWAKWQLAGWWRLAPGFRVLQKHLRFTPGASGLLPLSQAGDDPRTQGLLTSSMDLGPRISLDTTFRYVGALPDPHLSAYYQLESSLDWHISPQFDLSVSGFNLLSARHREYPDAEYIRRSVLAQLRWEL